MVKLPCLSNMLLHSFLQVLLCAPNIRLLFLVSDPVCTTSFINHNWMAAEIIIITTRIVLLLAIAWASCEVFGDNVTVQLGTHITIEDFTQVGEPVVRHLRANPFERGVLLVDELLYNAPYWNFPRLGISNAEVGV